MSTWSNVLRAKLSLEERAPGTAAPRGGRHRRLLLRELQRGAVDGERPQRGGAIARDGDEPVRAARPGGLLDMATPLRTIAMHAHRELTARRDRT
jgi:hypothetical protein